MIVSGWRSYPAAATVLRLAEQSKVAEVRAKLAHARPATGERTPSNNE